MSNRDNHQIVHQCVHIYQWHVASWLVSALALPVILAPYLLLGHRPDPAAWAVYSAIAVRVLALGAWLFRSLQRGFADVL